MYQVNWCRNIWCRTIIKSLRQQLRRWRQLMMERKSDLQNDDVTSAVIAVQVTATAQQQVRQQQQPATLAYVIEAYVEVARVSSWSAPEAQQQPTSHSTDSRASPVCAAQLASVHELLASRDQSTTKTSSQFLPLSVSQWTLFNFCICSARHHLFSITRAITLWMCVASATKVKVRAV